MQSFQQHSLKLKAKCRMCYNQMLVAYLTLSWSSNSYRYASSLSEKKIEEKTENN